MAIRSGRWFNLRFWTVGLMALPLLLACLSYIWLFWPLLDLLSIVAPLLILWNIVLTLYLVFRKRRLALIPLAPLLIAFALFEPVYKFASDLPEESIDLKILSYNIRSFYPGKEVGIHDADPDFLAFLESVEADIICIQELSPEILRAIKGYPYRYSTPPGSGHTLQAIFSKFPISGTGQVPFKGSTNNTIFADIIAGQDTLRIYNVHLESYKIAYSRFVYEDYGTAFFQRMGRVALHHREQAVAVKSHQQTAPYPTLICGDFNATAFSNTYYRMKRQMRDTFSERGQGLGTTYYLKGIPYRIDYILSDPGLEVTDHRTYKVDFSDHLPLSATLRLPGH